MLTLTSSAPFSARALADGLELSLVTALILNSCAKVGSARICLMTEPPWLPVAPKTVMILDILGFELTTMKTVI